MGAAQLLEGATSAGGIATARDGHVLLVVLDKPERLNALSSEMFTRLEEIFMAAGEDTSVRAIVITGRGKAFCSGADVGVLGKDNAASADEKPPKPMAKFTPRHCKIYKPTICAVNGMCASAGLHFVADCDIVIASDQAKFTDTHVNVGQVCAIEPIGLAQRMPLGPVLRMVILGKSERLSAEQALAMHMVSEVVPQDALLDRAMELAHTAASVSPTALQLSLKAIWESFEYPLEEAYEHGWRDLVNHRRHPDAIEGPKAFFEKRAPKWQ